MSTTQRKPYIVGNWKMNLTVSESLALVDAIASGARDNVDVGVCPSFIALAEVKKRLASSRVKVGAQNVHDAESGAFTGEVSIAMLQAVKCDLALVGHSERRQFFGDTDEWVHRKVKTLYAHGMDVILCVGETLEEREANETYNVVQKQLDGALGDLALPDTCELVVAYEPVWAIGTGRTATPEQAQEVHRSLRSLLIERYGRDRANTIRLLYGGSVKPDNAAGLLEQEDIDGALVGGAALKAEQFLGICNAAK